jgi:hypothetical protein
MPLASPAVDDLPMLTPAQMALADQRARCLAGAVAVLARRAPQGGFVSVRDTRAAARQAGTTEPQWQAERDMVRAAGFGRFKTAGLLGAWENLVSAADEAARWYGEPLDLETVSRRSLAWCLAGRPTHPLAELMTLSRDVGTDDVHDERARPSYRRLLDGWAAELAR